MSFVISDQVVLSQEPEGPIATYIGAFSDSLSSLGYCRYSIRRQVRLAACFSQWLKRSGVRLLSITSDHAVQYLRYRDRHQRPWPGDAAALRHLVSFLRHEGLMPPEKIALRRLTQVELCTQAYEKYLREARALARATIVNYVPFVRDFLNDRFGNGRVALSRLCAVDVVKFVQRQAPRLQMKRAKLMTTALRSFLNYLRYSGDVTLDLAAAVPVVPNWSMTSIPRAIATDQVHHLLASIDRRTAIGRRDYAILLLLARLGLRAGGSGLSQA